MIDRIDLMNHKCLSNLTLFCIAVKYSKEPKNDTSSMIFLSIQCSFCWDAYEAKTPLRKYRVNEHKTKFV